MAHNMLAEQHNRHYLFDIISKGSLSENEYTFSGLDKNGIADGYTFNVQLTTGIIERVDDEGNIRYFGLREKSRDARGYMNIEMVTPYNPDIFYDVQDKNIYRNFIGEITGVQFTCYIQTIIAIIHDVLESKTYDENERKVGNHMNGCKLDNNFNNVESCTNEYNIRHGLVFESLVAEKNDIMNLKHSNINGFGIKYIKNKQHVFPALVNGIHSDWVIEYEQVNSEFNDYLMIAKNSIRNIKRLGHINYIPTHVLAQFIWWLNTNEYWK